MISNTLSGMNKKSMNNLEKINEKISLANNSNATNNLNEILSTFDKLEDRKRKVEDEFDTAQMSDDRNIMNKKELSLINYKRKQMTLRNYVIKFMLKITKINLT